ncbi:MAG: hypothetical protein K6T66_15705 [Peptococcaceae bacterium]|nr:hypothetical protein [Peptococcaceae bacterium]
MGRKNIYVRDEDEVIWQKAEQLAGKGAAESLSKMITDALKKEVERLEALQEVQKDGFERILLEYFDKNANRDVKKAFNGKWLVFEEHDEATDAGVLVSVALTQKGQLLYFWVWESSGDGGYDIYEDFEAMKNRAEEDNIGHNIISAVADELGEDYVEFLDI